MEVKASDRVSLRKKHYAAIQQNKIKKLESSGKTVINLGRGNHDQSTFASIIGEFKKAITKVENHGYPPYGGKTILKKAIIDFYRVEYGVLLSQEEVTVFSGSLSSLTALPMILANPEDIILSPNPGFFAYDTGIKMAGALNYPMPLLEENDYFPNYDEIPSEILKKTKLMFLNYPHNPTGKGATKEFFDKTVAFAQKNNIIVAHDFAYADISFRGPSPSFLQATAAKEVGVEIFSLSKVFNMAGWRIAFAVGNREVIRLLNEYVHSSLGGTFGAVQDAVAFALANTKAERESLRELYRSRQKVAVSYLLSQNIDVLDSDGTFFLWIKLPTHMDDIMFADKLLESKQVAVIPGTVFGDNGKGYVRVSLVSDLTVILNGLEKLVSYLNEESK